MTKSIKCHDRIETSHRESFVWKRYYLAFCNAADSNVGGERRVFRVSGRDPLRIT